MISTTFFFIYLVIMILAAFFVIAPRNPIHSVGALIFIVLNFVFLLINLEAEYLALIFVAVYL